MPRLKRIEVDGFFILCSKTAHALGYTAPPSDAGEDIEEEENDELSDGNKEGTQSGHKRLRKTSTLAPNGRKHKDRRRDLEDEDEEEEEDSGEETLAGDFSGIKKRRISDGEAASTDSTSTQPALKDFATFSQTAYTVRTSNEQSKGHDAFLRFMEKVKPIEPRFDLHVATSGASALTTEKGGEGRETNKSIPEGNSVKVNNPPVMYEKPLDQAGTNSKGSDRVEASKDDKSGKKDPWDSSASRPTWGTSEGDGKGSGFHWNQNSGTGDHSVTNKNQHSWAESGYGAAKAVTTPNKTHAPWATSGTTTESNPWTSPSIGNKQHATLVNSYSQHALSPNGRGKVSTPLLPLPTPPVPFIPMGVMRTPTPIPQPSPLLYGNNAPIMTPPVQLLTPPPVQVLPPSPAVDKLHPSHITHHTPQPSSQHHRDREHHSHGSSNISSRKDGPKSSTEKNHTKPAKNPERVVFKAAIAELVKRHLKPLLKSDTINPMDFKHQARQMTKKIVSRHQSSYKLDEQMKGHIVKWIELYICKKNKLVPKHRSSTSSTHTSTPGTQNTTSTTTSNLDTQNSTSPNAAESSSSHTHSPHQYYTPSENTQSLANQTAQSSLETPPLYSSSPPPTPPTLNADPSPLSTTTNSTSISTTSGSVALSTHDNQEGSDRLTSDPKNTTSTSTSTSTEALTTIANSPVSVH